MPQATPPTAPDAQWAAVAAALDEEERREFLVWAWSLNLIDTSGQDEILATDVAGVLDALDEDLDAYGDLGPRLDLFFSQVPYGVIRPDVIARGGRAAALVLLGSDEPLTVASVTGLLGRAGLIPADQVVAPLRLRIDPKRLKRYLHRAARRALDPLGFDPGESYANEEFELPRRWNPRELTMDDIWDPALMVNEAVACGALIVPPGLTPSLVINTYGAVSSVDVEYGWKITAAGVDFTLFDDGHQLKYIAGSDARTTGRGNASAVLIEAMDQVNAMLVAYEKVTGREFRPVQDAAGPQALEQRRRIAPEVP